MLGAILGGASLLGKLFGGAGKGAADERNNQNDLISRDNMTRASLYGTQQGALSNAQALQERGTMDRARMGVSAPQQRMLQALLGSMMQNAQGAQFSGLPAGVSVPKMSGGVNPSTLINAFQRAGAGVQQRQAMGAALTGSDTPAPPDYVQSGVMPQPSMGGYKQPGKGESLLSLLGLIGAGAGGLQQMGVGRAKPPSSTSGSVY